MTIVWYMLTILNMDNIICVYIFICDQLRSTSKSLFLTQFTSSTMQHTPLPSIVSNHQLYGNKLIPLFYIIISQKKK